MKQRLIGMLALCSLLLCLIAPTALAAEPAAAEASPAGQIYLCGETHGPERVETATALFSLWT